MLTVLGTTTVDIFVRGVRGMPEKGDDEFSNSSLVWLEDAIVPSLGGNGANAAFAAAVLGEQVRLWSAIGTDPLGDIVLGWLGSRKVDLSDLMITPEASTATTIILTDSTLQRNSFHYPGPASIFRPFGGSAGKEGDWLLVSGYSLLTGWRGEATRSLLATARSKRVRTALDLGPVLGEPVTREELMTLLPNIDFLLCNVFELETVSGNTLDAGVKWAFSGGVGSIIVKKGADGAVVFPKAGDPAIEVPGFQVSVVGTVGAGDSFDAGFIHAYQQGSSVQESACFANAVAALVVSSPNGILDAPDADKVQAFLANAS